LANREVDHRFYGDHFRSALCAKLIHLRMCGIQGFPP